MVEISKLEYNPKLEIDQIFIGKSNVRQKNATEKIEELAKSIEEVDVLQPIVVIDRGQENQEGRYEVIIGQRRLLASKHLNRKDIPALIKKVATESEASILSFSENIHRLDLEYEDKMNIAIKLLEDLKSIDKVAERLGVTTLTVRNWLGYKGVWEELKDMVDEGGISATTALNISRAVTDKEKAIAIAKKVVEAPRSEDKSRIIKVAKENPDKNVRSILSTAKKLKFTKITLNLTPRIAYALQEASTETRSTESDIANEALEDWLKRKRFL